MPPELAISFGHQEAIIFILIHPDNALSGGRKRIGATFAPLVAAKSEVPDAP